MQLAFIRHQALLKSRVPWVSVEPWISFPCLTEAHQRLSAMWVLPSTLPRSTAAKMHTFNSHTHTPFHPNTNEQFCQQSPQTSHTISADHQFIEKEKALSSRLFSLKQCCSGQLTQTFRVSTFHLVIACGSHPPLMHSQRMVYYRDVAWFFESGRLPWHVRPRL